MNRCHYSLFQEKKEPKPLKLKQVGTKGKNSKACKKTAKKETKEKTEPQQTKKGELQKIGSKI